MIRKNEFEVVSLLFINIKLIFLNFLCMHFICINQKIDKTVLIEEFWTWSWQEIYTRILISST